MSDASMELQMHRVDYFYIGVDPYGPNIFQLMHLIHGE